MDRYAEICRNFRWDVPAQFNIAEACCRRWSTEPQRVALKWEDEGGATASYTFSEVAQSANRLSNALRGLGVQHGDRVAVLLPQRPETAISFMAILQLGAIAVPLSHLFGPDALEVRLTTAGVSVAIADSATLPVLCSIKTRLPELREIIGVAGAAEADTKSWEALLAASRDQFEPDPTPASQPAFLIFTSGTTGPAKGALIPHRALIGNIPGFVHSHDFYPQPGDMFWSPADWAWTGGLMDALLPSWYFGQPLLGYRGRFDAEKAYYLLEKYAVRNTFIFPTALKFMMKAVPAPRDRYSLNLRSLMSAGESVGTTLIEWGRDQLGVTINEMFGQTEANYVVGNSHTAWPVKPGSIGRAYPGHRVAIIDESGIEVSRGELGEIGVAHENDPVMFLEYWKNPEATAQKFVGPWARTGDQGKMDEDGYIRYQGRTDDVIKSAGYRIGPAEVESCLMKHPDVANVAVIGKPDAERGQIVKAFVVLQSGVTPNEELRDALKRHVRSRLAPYEYPREVEFLTELPMTTTGKIRRTELRQRER
jgi:acetyl-CoA synthetase